jgi:hypothetical protein
MEQRRKYQAQADDTGKEVWWRDERFVPRWNKDLVTAQSAKPARLPRPAARACCAVGTARARDLTRDSGVRSADGRRAAYVEKAIRSPTAPRDRPTPFRQPPRETAKIFADAV